MTRGEPTAQQTLKDPQLQQLVSDVAFKDSLAKLIAEAESAQAKLRQFNIPGLGPLGVLDIHRRYLQRECEKAQLRIEILKLPREIEELERRREWTCTPGARLQHKRRCMMLEAGRALGRSRSTSLPEPPELEAKRKLNSAMAALESKKRRLQEITVNDDEWNALIHATPAPRRLVTQAPPPPQVVGGSWVPRQPKPTELPTSFPPGFPTSLVLNARVILADVVREFPDRSKLETLCKVLVSRYTDLLCTGVRSGVIKAHEAPEELNTIVHYLLVANCAGDTKRFEIKQAMVNSDEWHAMLKRLLECKSDAQPADAKPTHSAKTISSTRQRIDAFLQTMRQHGHRTTRKDIWQVAGYGDATEFQRFQREDLRATAGSRQQFDRVLTLSPEEFIQKLHKVRSK